MTYKSRKKRNGENNYFVKKSGLSSPPSILWQYAT
jgi:hypothetical protein